MLDACKPIDVFCRHEHERGKINNLRAIHLGNNVRLWLDLCPACLQKYQSSAIVQTVKNNKANGTKPARGDKEHGQLQQRT